MNVLKFLLTYILVPVILTPLFTSFIQGKIDKSQFSFIESIPFDKEYTLSILVFSLFVLINFQLLKVLKNIPNRIRLKIVNYYDNKRQKYRLDNYDPSYIPYRKKLLINYEDTSIKKTINVFHFEIRYSLSHDTYSPTDVYIDFIIGPFCSEDDCKVELLEKKSRFGKYFYYTCPSCGKIYKSKDSKSHMKFLIEKKVEGKIRNEQNK